MPIICPNCGSTECYFRQEYTSYASIDNVQKNGSIDLGETKKDVPHGEYVLCCEVCGWSGDGNEHNERKKTK
jgi:hypothetical protein